MTDQAPMNHIAPNIAPESLPPLRAIKGLPGFQISPAGELWVDAYGELVTKYEHQNQYVTVSDGKKVIINALAAAAAEWLSPEQVKLIADEFPPYIHHTDPELPKFEAAMKVSKWVILSIIRDASKPAVEQTEIEGGTIEWSEIDGYTSFVDDPRFKSVRGRLPDALHRHEFNIGIYSFYFTAYSRNQWAHQGDKVAFSFYLDQAGRRVLLRNTYRGIDATGAPVMRGNRKFVTIPEAPAPARPGWMR